MPDVQLLSPDILTRFESLLRSRNVKIVDAWAPGLSDAQIDDIIGPAGLQMPEEVRVWWRWHNGVRPGSPPDHWMIVPGRDLLRLQDAVDTYSYVGRGDGLLKPFSEKPHIYVACRATGKVPAPVYYETYDFSPHLALPSFGELILGWIRYIDSGGYPSGPDGWTNDKTDPEGVEEFDVL